MILAKLNQPEFEYDIHSLIKAFFPEENVSATSEDKKYEEECYDSILKLNLGL